MILDFEKSSLEAANATFGLVSILLFLLRVDPFQDLLNWFDLYSPLLCIVKDICALGRLLFLSY